MRHAVMKGVQGRCLGSGWRGTAPGVLMLDLPVAPFLVTISLDRSSARRSAGRLAATTATSAPKAAGAIVLRAANILTCCPSGHRTRNLANESLRLS